LAKLINLVIKNRFCDSKEYAMTGPPVLNVKGMEEKLELALYPRSKPLDVILIDFMLFIFDNELMRSI
jgi:hypothetical protein